MDLIISWFNNNTGFISAILSALTLFISVLAIIISIKMARLPYKKRIKLSGTTGFALGPNSGLNTVVGFYVNLCNIGNRDVNIKFLGLAVSKEGIGKYDLIRNLNSTNSSSRPIKPTESFEVEYLAEGLIQSLQRIDRSRVLYYYAEDTEGWVVKKRYSSVDSLLKMFGL